MKNTMKKFSIFLAASLLSINFNLFSQDIIDPPKLNQFDSLSILNTNKVFVRGWNWGLPGNMLDSAMFFNTYHSYKYEWFQDANASTHNLNIINRPGRDEGKIVAGRNSDGIFNAHSLYFEPATIIACK